MRNVIVAVTLVGVAVGVYMYRHDAASNRIKAEMLLIVEDMTLSPTGRGEVKRLINDYHEESFRRALNPAKDHGHKFDEKNYYEAVFGLIVDRLRDDGKIDLADKVERQKAHFSLRVTER